MQHGRASSAIAARSFVGRSRIMSLLMALFLFAGIGLAIPGFAARADDAVPHYALRAGLISRPSSPKPGTGDSSSIMGVSLHSLVRLSSATARR